MEFLQESRESWKSLSLEKFGGISGRISGGISEVNPEIIPDQIPKGAPGGFLSVCFQLAYACDPTF